ncbi:MAG: rRNA maturation RNase YbeY [Hyphomicrobiales bacterium]|nr:rRNA maturation RNase YbeY [Hyphomicrobiales bacterium]PCJ91510.1 MAG: rRNA maturation RNase YbeY [Hyphomicrobiales bacterium]
MVQLEFEGVIEDSRWGFAEGDGSFGAFLSKIAGSIVAGYPALSQPVQASVLLANDSRVQTLNRDYRNQDKPTNVLSFESGETEADPETGRLYLGDIAISFETVQREADEAGKTLLDHLSHMVVHGTLHLCGFDHLNDDEAEEMETLETAILETLGISNPYAES